MKLYEKYSPMVLEKYEEMGTEMKKLMIQADEIYTKTSKDAIRMYKEMTSDAMKTWMGSELRSKLMNLKKMTIKQTIKELTVLPMKIKVFVVKNYNELYNKVEAELTKRYADSIKMYTEKYNEAKEFITKKYNEIIVIITPTLKEVKSVVDWVATEISETGIFVYRYYMLSDRYNQMVAFIEAEVRRIGPIVQEAAMKYYKQYETEATKVAMKYYKQYETEATKVAMKYYKQYETEATKVA